MSKVKFDITVAVPGLPFNAESFDKQSLGGSESAGYYLARALGRMGHRVTMFCNTHPMRSAEMDFLPISMYRQYIESTRHDITIAQRSPELFAGQHQARLAALWCHDLALKRQQPVVLGTAWNYDKLVVLSQFHAQQYKEVYGVSDEFLYVTRNGVDLAAVEAARLALEKDGVQRNPLALFFTARPERGLDVMLGEIMPRVLEQEPNAKLYLATYNNPVDHLNDLYQHCNSLAKRLGDRVVMLGAMPKSRLYESLMMGGVYCYPLPSKIAPDFDEISCISAMEAQACGLPIVATARGALPETVAPGAGTLLSDPVLTPEYFDAFAAATVRYMRDPEAARTAGAAGRERAQQLDWSKVAEEWTEMFEREIRKNNSDYATLANHFWRQSDIYAARECLRKLPIDDAKSAYTRERVMKDWAFLDEKDGFRLQYERIGATHDARVIDFSPQEPRYFALRGWLVQHFQKLCAADPTRTELKVLDYGCAHGGYATNLLKELPFLRITGVDIDQHGIEMAYSFAEKLGVTDRWRGVVGDIDRLSDPNVPEMNELYDVVLAQEVMEHVADPRALLIALEARVADGGTVYATVPFGPWEYTDYRQLWAGSTSGYPYRAHIWEFDLHDLHDLLDVKGKDGDATISVMPFSMSEPLRMPLGWHVINYSVTAATRGIVGPIDMERKLWLQRPRQTVSACIMAGGPVVEDTMHWCLKSLRDVADEVVIVDTGMSDEARRMLQGYDSRVRIIPGPDPKQHGFETPRNVGLQECTQDWVHWIDMDEKLLQPECMTKYLRPNIYNGYSIKQHHFAVDTSFDPDLPVRFFRNPLNTKSGMRFFGMIHEHPETSLNAGPGLTLGLTDVHIAHVGYLIESGRQRRFQRNLPMLNADIARYPDRKLQKHFIMRDMMLLCSYELQQTGGRVTEEMRNRARQVVALYREHFLGKGHFTNVNPLMYYSQANQILGEGFDTVFQFEADKLDAKPNGHAKIRFACEEDAVIEMSRMVRDKAAPFVSRYF